MQIRLRNTDYFRRIWLSFRFSEGSLAGQDVPKTRFPVQTPLSFFLGFETQHHYETPGDPLDRIRTDVNDWNLFSDAALLNITQNCFVFVFLFFSIAKIKIQYANKIVSYKRYGPNYLQTRRDTWIPCSILLTSDSCFYPCFWPVLHRFCLYNRETNCMYFNYFNCKSKTTFGKVIKQKKKIMQR